MKKLVAYFSATGVTAQVAEVLAESICADIFEIRPTELYTKDDLNWWENGSRSTVEMSNPSARPKIAKLRDNIADYDVIFVGFPIWWNVAPRIINTFLESDDFSKKIIIPFATSGRSDAHKVNDSIKGSCAGAKLAEAALLNSDMSYLELSEWAESILKSNLH